MGSVVKSRGRAVVMLLAVVSAVACSSDPEINTDPIPVTTFIAPVATTTTSPATSTPPPETTAPPTTAAPTTTEPDTTEADIREAVDQLMLLTISELNTGQPRNPAPELLERWLTGQQLDRSRDIIDEQLAVGRYYEGDFTWRVESINVTAAVATVLVCIADDTVGFESNGSVFDPDGTFSIFEVTLRESDGLWQTSDFIRKDEPCVV